MTDALPITDKQDDPFADPAARSEFEAWHDQLRATIREREAAKAAKAAKEAAKEPVSDTPEAIAARYTALADAALYARQAHADLAKLDPADKSEATERKRRFRRDRLDNANLQLGIAYAELNPEFDRDWLDGLYDAAGYECVDGEWFDPTEAPDTYDDDVAYSWRNR